MKQTNKTLETVRLELADYFGNGANNENMCSL